MNAGYLWTIFIVVVLALLLLDLGVFHRKAHTIKFKEALTWCCVWTSLALLFNLGIFYFQGSDRALEFLTGYVIEQSLSIDNIFIFIMVFAFFGVPDRHQHRVLFYGILGAIIMRALFIFLGIGLFAKFHWLTYVFGAILIFTAYKLLKEGEAKKDIGSNVIVRLCQKYLRTTPTYYDERFFVRIDKKLFATPLFLVLIVLEGMDLMFAIDSIPAIFAITRDPFIVFSSNIFAILGLRSLFFLVAGALQKISLLRFGLAAILAFVGIKMLISGYFHIPTLYSFAVIFLAITSSIIASLVVARRPHGGTA